MSRLTRRVERNQDRRTLGNRKKRIEREQLMVLAAMKQGAEWRMQILHNSTAGLDYGTGYYVAPTVETLCTDVESDGGLALPVSPSAVAGATADNPDTRWNPDSGQFETPFPA